MKKLFLFLSLAGVSCVLNAENANITPQEYRIPDLSAGQYSYASPNKNPDNSANLILNFNTDIQALAVERNGSAILDSGLGSANANVAGLWKFVDVNSNEWIIEFSSRTYYKHTLGGTPTAFGPVTTSGNTPRAAVNLGKIWFVNGADRPWSFDGTSTMTISAAPIGKTIVAWRTRIVISGVSASQSTVYFSGDGDGTSWSLGGNPTDPFTVQIGGANDGYQVNCMGIYVDAIVVQRKYDSWFVLGTDQSDVELRNVSSEVGCIDPGTNREFDGTYMFVSVRGIEEMSGSVIKRVSDPIRDITDSIVKNSANQRSILQTSQSDWTGGTITAGTSFYFDPFTNTGKIQPTFPDLFSSYRNGQNGTASVWQDYCYGGCISTNVSVANNAITLRTGNSDEVVKTQRPTAQFAVGTTFYVVISSITSFPLSNRSDYQFGVSSISTLTANPTTLNNVFYFTFQSSANAQMSLLNINNTSDGLICTACQTNTSSIPARVAIWLSTTNYQVTVNDVVVKAGTHTFPNNSLYLYNDYFWGQAGTGQLAINQFNIIPETFTYTTSLMNPGTAVSAWGNLDVTDTQPTSTGTITYQFGSTNTAVIGNISNYTNTTNHSVPTVSTNPYAAVRAIFNQTGNPTTPLSIDDITINWLEGAAPPMASAVYDGRYWLAYTNQTGASPRNNRDLIYQRNRTWVEFDLPVSSFAIWRDKLYFGDSALTGNVFQFDIGNNDNGSAITSEIDTKSYDFGIFNQDKDYARAYASFLGNSAYTGTFSLAYKVDQSTYSFALGSANMNDGQGQTLSKFWFPMSNPLQGREIQYVITKSGIGNRLQLFDLKTNFTIKEEQ